MAKAVNLNEVRKKILFDQVRYVVKRRFERGGFGELISEFSSPRFRSFHADGTLPAV